MSFRGNKDTTHFTWRENFSAVIKVDPWEAGTHLEHWMIPDLVTRKYQRFWDK